MSAKPFSIVVWGASGFTGQLVAQYLSMAPSATGVKWAVAGRNKSKLEQRMKEVGLEGVPVLVADAADADSLVALCQETRLIISLVGPYTLYGEPLVKACSEQGVHYVDLTGEAPFVAHMIRKYARNAISTRAIIIHSCGYDSVPSDLTTFLAIQRLKNLAGTGVQVGDVRAAFAQKGTASGGTIASALAILEGTAEDLAISRNPYALSPVAGAHKPKPILATSSTFNGKKTWGAFWVMGPFNSMIVRRSWGIFESADPSSKVLSYGPAFAYNEFLTSSGPIVAVLTSLAVYAGFAFLLFFPPAKWLLRRYGPKPGEGPSAELQKTGWFTVTTTAKSVDHRHEAQVTMRGKGDPGYAATSKMIAECALAIVQDYERLPPLARQGGPLTPATALGSVLVERLEATGNFSFTSEDPKSK